jgi:hypothetical protein
VVSVQVADAYRINLVKAGITLQRAEGAAAKINQQPEAVGLNQVAGSGAVRPGEAARAADYRQSHRLSIYQYGGERGMIPAGCATGRV